MMSIKANKYYIPKIYMNRLFVRRNITSIAIVIFLVMFYGINSFTPGFLYERDGSFREFGINSKKKTVIPVWLLAIVLAFISYLGVLYYLALPKIYY